MSIQIRRKWKPHPAQAQVLEDDTRFRICVCGRRFGKTEMCHHEAFEYALENPGSRVWWVAPTYGDANEMGYDRLEQDIIPDALIADKKRTSPRKITLTNGSVISFRSAERMDSLRGRGLDLLVIDEAGSTPDRAWQAELRPSLSDTGGSMIAIGTPRGRNWFHTWFNRGKDDSNTNTTSFQFTSYENPHVPDEEIEDSREELPKRVFEREYLAQFADDEGAVFGDVEARNVQQYPLDSVYGDAPYTMGVDLGRAQNFTAITVLDASGLLVHADRLRGGSWSKIGNTIKAVHENYYPATAYMDATRDNALIENLKRDGLDVEAIRFTPQKKTEMIENLAARLELKEIMISPDAENLIHELKAFQFETTKSGDVSYSAPAGVKDDYVDSLALAANKPQNAYKATW